MKLSDPNIAKVELVAVALGILCERLVLVGGCAAGLLFTDAAVAPARVTYDVDLLAEVVALSDYYQLERALAERGFTRDLSTGAPICRWRIGTLEVDLMPSEVSVLGFSNRWYPIAVQTAQSFRLPSGTMIRLISAAAFMATKLVAFYDRGNNDYLASHDLEDVINLVDGRPELAEEIDQAPAALREYLIEQCDQLLATAAFREGLHGLVMPDASHETQLEKITQRLMKIAQLKSS